MEVLIAYEDDEGNTLYYHDDEGVEMEQAPRIGDTVALMFSEVAGDPMTGLYWGIVESVIWYPGIDDGPHVHLGMMEKSE